MSYSTTRTAPALAASSTSRVQRRNTRTLCCASQDQNCIRRTRCRSTWEKPCGNEPHHVHSWQCEARRGSPQIQVHATRHLAVRGSNKNFVTPWGREAREAVFQNLGVVQDLLRKWCHQFRTAAWPRRIVTTNLSQHHSNEACLSRVVKKNAQHTTTQIKISAGDICD